MEMAAWWQPAGNRSPCHHVTLPPYHLVRRRALAWRLAAKRAPAPSRVHQLEVTCPTFAPTRLAMNILDIRSPKAIKVPLDAGDKKTAIDELVDLLASAGLITQPESLRKVVWEREQQRTTGIGEGLAIPHGKANSSKGLVIAIGRPAQPIDFGSIDNKPVKLIVLLASPPEKTSDHIQALGKISRLMADPKFRNAAYAAP